MPLPISMTLTGSQVNSGYLLRSTLVGGYQPELVEPVTNHVQGRQNKPLGGCWAATVNPNTNLSSWDIILDPSATEPVQHTMRGEPAVLADLAFTPSAKVVRINSFVEYATVLDAYSYQPPSDVSWSRQKVLTMPGDAVFHNYTVTGEAKRALDYERLAQEFDALLITEQCLQECGKQPWDLGPEACDFFNENISLEMWDIETAYIMNSACVQPR